MEITEEQALDCLMSDDLIGIGMEADQVRQRLHPEQVVTYTIDAKFRLNFASKALPGGHPDTVAPGKTALNLVRGTRSLPEVEHSLSEARRKSGPERILALWTADVPALADEAGTSIAEALVRLHGAGLDAISGDDLCALGGTARLSLAQWLEVHRAAHRAGIRSTAGLVFGTGESLEQRTGYLSAIRRLQEETAGFLAFTPWSYKPKTERSEFEEPTAVEYLRMLAVSRMFLDNVPNVESSCAAQGLKVVQMGLRFGANDAGSITTGEPVGRSGGFTEEDLRRVIRDAGFSPVERDALYHSVFLAN